LAVWFEVEHLDVASDLSLETSSECGLDVFYVPYSEVAKELI
jgi:hypothetical protein